MASRTNSSRVNTHLHDQILNVFSPQKDHASARLPPPRSRVPSANSARSHYSEDLLPEPLSIIKTPSPSPKKAKAKAEAEPQPKKIWEIRYISSPRIQCFKSNIPGDVYITVKPPKWNLDRKGRRIKMDLSNIKEFAEPTPIESPCCEQSDFAVKPTATTPYNSIKSGSSFYSAESTMAAAAARGTPPNIFASNGSPVPRKAALLKTGVVGGVASSGGAVSYGAAGGEVRSPSPTNTLLSDDGARRLQKYEVGPTVRQSKDAHDIIMGITEPSPSPKLEKKSSIPSLKTRRGSFGFTRRSSSKNEVRSEEKEAVVREATPPLPTRAPSGGAYSSRLPKPAFAATASRLARPTASSANREAVAKAARGKITKEMISAPVRTPAADDAPVRKSLPVASTRQALPVSGTMSSFKRTSKDIKSRFSSMLPGRRSLPVAVADTSSRHSQLPVVGPAAGSAFGSARRVSQLGHVASLHDRASISITSSGYAKLATNNTPSLHGSIFNNAPSVHGSVRNGKTDGKTDGKKTDARASRVSISPEPRSPSVNLTTYEGRGLDDDAAVSAFIADVTEELTDKVDKDQVERQRSEQATRAEHNAIARQANITAQGTFHAGPSHTGNANGGDEPPTPPQTSSGPSGHYIDAGTITDTANNSDAGTITDATPNATASTNADASTDTSDRPASPTLRDASTNTSDRTTATLRTAQSHLVRILHRLPSIQDPQTRASTSEIASLLGDAIMAVRDLHIERINVENIVSRLALRVGDLTADINFASHGFRAGERAAERVGELAGERVVREADQRGERVRGNGRLVQDARRVARGAVENENFAENIAAEVRGDGNAPRAPRGYVYGGNAGRRVGRFDEMN